MNRLQRCILLVIAAVTCGAAVLETADAQSEVNVLEGNGIAIHGYDPVAYFAEGTPRKGRADLVVHRNGARWLFSSEGNRDRFLESPETYLPAYGGYCAYGVAQGYLVKIDPEAWRIVDGKLYLNYDLSVAQTWLKDVPRYIASANTKWPGLVGRQ